MGPKPNRTRYSFLSFFLVLLVLLTFTSPSWAQALKTIAPNAWTALPDGTTATIPNTGLATVRGTNLIKDFAVGEVRPSGLTADKKMVMAQGYSGFSVDSSTGANCPYPSGGTNLDYYVSFWTRWTGDIATMAVADNTGVFNCQINTAGGGTNPDLFCIATVRNPAAASNLYRSRVGITFRERTANTGPALGTERFLGGIVGGSNDMPHIRVNQWVKFTRRMHLGAGDGFVADYIDGVMVNCMTGIDYTGIISENLHNLAWEFYWFGATGLTWEVAPEFNSWRGTGNPIEPVFPAKGSVDRPSNRGMTHHYGVEFAPDLILDNQGTFWRFSATSGSPTISSVGYGITGITPGNNRLVMTAAGAAVGELVTRSEVGDIGELQYDSKGWCNVTFNHIYVPGAGSVKLKIKAKDSSAVESDLITLDINATTGLTHNGRWLAPIDANDRYQVWVGLDKTGLADWTLVNLSEDYTTKQLSFGGRLGQFYKPGTTNVAPTELSRLGATLTRGTADIEFGAADVGWNIGFAVGDSYWHGYTYALGQVQIPVSGGSGSFTPGEQVNETGSPGTGTFVSLVGSTMTLTNINPAWLGSGTLTGQSSAATRTGGALTAWTRVGMLKSVNNLSSEFTAGQGSPSILNLWRPSLPTDLKVADVNYIGGTAASGNSMKDHMRNNHPGLMFLHAATVMVPCWTVNSFNDLGTLSSTLREANAQAIVADKVRMATDFAKNGVNIVFITSPQGTAANFTADSLWLLQRERALLLPALAAINQPQYIMVLDEQPDNIAFFTGSGDFLHPLGQGARMVNSKVSGQYAGGVKCSLFRPKLVNSVPVYEPVAQ